jgi:hypothetical protein
MQLAADWAERAKAGAVRVTTGDVSADLAYQIGIVGLGRIHGLQEHLGQEPDAKLLVAPDATPSSNTMRCQAGFASGTRYWWSPGEPWLPVGFGPNACGLCVVGLPEMPDPVEVRDRLDQMQARPPKVDGLPLVLDIGRRNHFIGIFTVHDAPSLSCSHVAVLHCSAPELANVDRPHQRVKPRPEIVRTLNTAAGPISYVVGEDASSFWESFVSGNAFAVQKRSTIASVLFPEGEVLSNRMHQGYASSHEIVLGSHVGDADSHYVYLGGFASPSYLYQPSTPGPSIAPDVALATRDGRLLPHGGGASYSFADQASVTVDEEGCIRILLGTKDMTVDLRHTSDLPYEYRSGDTFQSLEASGFCAPTAKITPCYCFRV